MQLSIDIEPDLYRKVESLASLRGESIEDFVLQQMQSVWDKELQAMRDLLDFLEPDIVAAKNGNVSKKTFKEIVKEVLEGDGKNESNDIINVH